MSAEEVRFSRDLDGGIDGVFKGNADIVVLIDGPVKLVFRDGHGILPSAGLPKSCSMVVLSVTRRFICGRLRLRVAAPHIEILAVVS